MVYISTTTMPSAVRSVHYATGRGFALAKPSVLLGFDARSRIGTIGGMIALMKDDKGRKMISCREAAEAYGCSMRYIRKLAKDGKVASEVVGGAYMVAADEVRRLAGRKAAGRERKRSEGFKAG